MHFIVDYLTLIHQLIVIVIHGIKFFKQEFQDFKFIIFHLQLIIVVVNLWQVQFNWLII